MLITGAGQEFIVQIEMCVSRTELVEKQASGDVVNGQDTIIISS